MLGDGDRIIIRSYTLTTHFSSLIEERDPFGLDDLMAKPIAKPDNGSDPFDMLIPANRHGAGSAHRHESTCASRFSQPIPGGATDETTSLLQAVVGEHESLRDFHSNRGSGLVEDIAPLPDDDYHDSLRNHNLDPMVTLGKPETNNSLGFSGDTFRPQTSFPFDDLLASLSPNSMGNWNAAGSNQSFVPLVDLGGHRPVGTISLEHVHDINLPYTPPSIPEAAHQLTAQVSADTSPAQSIDDLFATLKTYINNTPVPPEPLPQPPFQQNDFPASPASESFHPLSTIENNANEQMQLLINAFRNSAGLSSQPIQAEEAIAYMESVGVILRAAIEGISSLLASRAMLKGELGAEDRTMVATRDNNPLKLMPDIQDVMQFLFEQKKLNSLAYLTPVQSIAGACEDLVYHELGTVAGMRAAVEGSILRFNPQLIEAELDKSGKRMVLMRKAALWETYVENYRKIEMSMADDIGRIFERDFRRAYDAQISQLKKK